VMAERRRLLVERRDALALSLGREGPGWRFEVPRGGLCLWVDVGSTEARALADAALNVGIRVIPGPTFALEGGFDHRLRLPFTQPPDALERAVRGLAAAERLLRAELRADAGQAKPRLEDPRRR